MKKSILLVGLILLVASCEKESTDDNFKVYSNTKGTLLTVIDIDWYTTKMTEGTGGFGTVNLAIAGLTNADSVTVETYGDGVIDEEKLALDAKKNFGKDTIPISFTYYSTSAPTEVFEKSTKIRAYRATDTLTVTLKSGKLHY